MTKNSLLVALVGFFVLWSSVYAGDEIASGSSGESPNVLSPEEMLKQMEEFNKPDGLHHPYEGAGTEFVISNSVYSNLKITSSARVHIIVEAITNTLSLHLEPAPDLSDGLPDLGDLLEMSQITSTVITVSGLEIWGNKDNPLPYFLHQDGFSLSELKPNSNGEISWIQDLTSPHHTFILPSKNTLYIGTDLETGPPSEYYTYDKTTKTYTLVKDINEPVVIVADGITLDGNLYKITGAGYGYGIYLYGRTAITIKNCTVQNFNCGIYLYSSSYNTLITNTANSNAYYGILLVFSSSNTLTNNTANSNTHSGIYLYVGSNNNTLTNNTTNSNGIYGGIYLDYSSNNVLSDNTANSNLNYGIRLGFNSNNTLTNNTVNSNRYGIFLSCSSNNTLTDNTILKTLGQRQQGLFIYGIDISHYQNNITTSNTINGLPVNYYDGRYRTCPNNAILNLGSNWSWLGLVNCTNVTATATNNLDHVLLAFTSQSTIKGMNVSDIYYGIYLYSSSANTVINNTANSTSNGIYLDFSSNNNLTNNRTDSNNCGIFLRSNSNHNILTNNTANSNFWYGMELYQSHNNILTNNTADSNSYYGIYLSQSPDNIVYHNNIWGNVTNVSSDQPIELSYFNPETQRYEGNWWGRTTAPGFIAGVDSNAANVVDSYPYLVKDGWLKGYAPGEPEIIDATPPTGSVSINAGAYATSSTSVTLTLLASDPESGVPEMRLSNDNVTWSSWLPYQQSKDWNLLSGDGIKTVYCQYKNGVGLVSETYSDTIILDTKPPVTTATITPPPNPAGWNNTAVLVTLKAVDPDTTASGVKEVYYCVTSNGVVLNELLASGDSAIIPLNKEGVFTVSYYAVDNADNTEVTKETTVRIDGTPPVIAFTQSPPPNEFGWNKTDVTITFSATDALSGIESITPQITLITEGAGQVVTGTAVDKAGNQSAKSVAVNIDKTPPDITITSPQARDYLNIETFIIDFAITDTLSGLINGYQVYLDGSQFINGILLDKGVLINLSTLLLGEHTFKVMASDKAGVQSVQSVVFKTIQPVEAITEVSADLQEMIAQTVDPKVKEILTGAWELLVGNEQGRANNGAIDKLNDGDLIAAFTKIWQAIKKLKEAQKLGAPTQQIQQDLANLTKELVRVRLDVLKQDPNYGPTHPEVIIIQKYYDNGVAFYNAAKYEEAVKQFRLAQQKIAELDKEPPLITFITPRSGEFVNTLTPDILVAYTDKLTAIRTSSIRVWIDGTEYTGVADITAADLRITGLTLTEGSHTLTVSVNDAASPTPNNTTDSITFTIDITPAKEYHISIDLDNDPVPPQKGHYYQAAENIAVLRIAVTDEDGNPVSRLPSTAFQVSFYNQTIMVNETVPPGTYAGTVDIFTPPMGWHRVEATVAHRGIITGTATLRWLIAGPGDINGDGYVGSTDQTLLQQAFNTQKGDANYIEQCDLIGDDDIIDTSDAAVVSNNYGKEYEYPEFGIITMKISLFNDPTLPVKDWYYVGSEQSALVLVEVRDPLGQPISGLPSEAFIATGFQGEPIELTETITPGTYQGTVNISTPPIGWRVISVDLTGSGVVASESISWLFAGVGDINADGVVNEADHTILEAAYGTRKGDPNYNEQCDLAGDDDQVNISDAETLVSNWEKQYKYSEKWKWTTPIDGKMDLERESILGKDFITIKWPSHLQITLPAEYPVFFPELGVMITLYQALAPGDLIKEGVWHYGKDTVIDVACPRKDKYRNFKIIQLAKYTAVFEYPDGSKVEILRDWEVDGAERSRRFCLREEERIPYYNLQGSKKAKPKNFFMMEDSPGFNNPQDLVGDDPYEAMDEEKGVKPPPGWKEKPLVPGTKVTVTAEFKTWVISTEAFKVFGYLEWGFTMEFILGEKGDKKAIDDTLKLIKLPDTPKWVPDQRGILDDQLKKERYPPLPPDTKDP